MKRFAFLVLIVFFAVEGFAQTNFRFVPSMMMPVEFPSRDVSPDFWVEVKNDTVDCYLPYFGVAYSAPIDNDGLKFVSEIKDRTTKTKTKKKKNSTETTTFINFTAKKNGFETYRFSFTLFDNGKADLSLYPSNAQNISYNGDWE